MDFYYLSFYCFTTTINFFYYLFLIYCVSNTISPVRTQNFLLDSSWASIRLYHCFKNKSKNFVKSQLNVYLNDDIKNLLSKKEELELERTFYIKDGNETNCLMNDADMVLTFLNNLKTTYNNVPVLRSNEADSFNTALIDTKICDYKFITIVLIQDKNNKKQTFQIDLNKPFNYYIDGNILLDYTFIKWYAKKYYQLNINKYDYAVEIFDNNANYIYLTSEHQIILNKNDYKVQAVTNQNINKICNIDLENLITTNLSNLNEETDCDKLESGNEIYTLKHRKSVDINLEN
jgi:hypothetical protein